MNTIIKRTWNQNRMMNIEDLRGMAFQAEDGGHTFEISGINDANEAVSLSGTVAGVFMRPDGTDVALTGTASDGVVSVTLSDACYAVAGRFGLTIFVTADGKKTCVYACVGTVSQTSYGTVAGDTPQDVVDLINAINASIASIPADYTDLLDAIASAFSPSVAYASGMIVWYDGNLYQFTADKSAGSWDTTKVRQIALADDVITHFGGGTTGQILRKKSVADYDVEWVNTGTPTDEQVGNAVDNWLDEHPEATTTVQDSSLTTVKFANVVTPDQFTGTDSQKLAAAINSLVNGGIVLLGRTYTLTEDVVINRISSAPKVTVKGINSSGLIDCASYTFTGTNSGNDGNICFDGVIFKGDTSNGLFDAYYLIRMYFTNCSFSNFASLVYNSRSNQERVYIQSYYFMNCCIRHIYDYIIKLTNGASTIDWIIDVRFTENNIEWCHSGLVYGNYYQGFVFSNNALEGFVTEDTLVTRVMGARGFVFNDNYFEKNKCTYIDMTAPIKNAINAEIANNMLMEDTTEDVNFLLLPLVNTPGMIRIINNYVEAKPNSGCYFIYVNDSVTEQLSNVLVEGTYYASTHLQLKHDTNNRIKTTESFSVLNNQYKILEKISSLVDTSSGSTKTLSISLMGTALNSNTVSMVANIPFYLQSYSVELIKVEMVNLGNITSNSSVYGTLRNNGFEIRATGLSVTSGATYTGYATVKLTFV